MRGKLVKISVAASLIALVAGASLAQTPAAPHDPNNFPAQGRAGRRMGRQKLDNPVRGEQAERRALRHLNLTDAQRQQMRAIEQRYGQTFRADREELRKLVETRRGGASLTPEQQARARQLREELRANADRMRGELQNLLTPEQRQQMEQSREEIRKRRAERTMPPAPGNA
ncbi:MAG: motif family protein, partial [Acidobacteriota bacterium]|nr:motif family protein [Acidobacteriota bacterium]